MGGRYQGSYDTQHPKKFQGILINDIRRQLLSHDFKFLVACGVLVHLLILYLALKGNMRLISETADKSFHAAVCSKSVKMFSVRSLRVAFSYNRFLLLLFPGHIRCASFLPVVSSKLIPSIERKII